jgi:hypothetical protein
VRVADCPSHKRMEPRCCAFDPVGLVVAALSGFAQRVFTRLAERSQESSALPPDLAHDLASPQLEATPLRTISTELGRSLPPRVI